MNSVSLHLPTGAPELSFQIPDGKAHCGLCLLNVEQVTVKEAAGADSVKIKGLTIGQRSDHWRDTQVDQGVSSVQVKDQGFLTNKELISAKEELSEVNISSVSQSEMLPEQSLQKNVFILHKVEENHLGLKEIDGINTHNESSEILCELHHFQRIHTDDKEHHCNKSVECGKRFIQGNNLVCHQRIYQREKLSPCPESKKTFILSENLKHRQIIHREENPTGYTECVKSFITSLKCHQIFHRGEKPYQCADCGKAFSHGWVLKRHQRIHTGEKPYQCPVCRRAFNLADNLKRHQRIHIGEWPYRCSECGYLFTLADHLKRHKNIHMREKCHQKTHKGEQPYQCDECWKRFSLLKSLKLHQAIHVGDKLSAQRAPGRHQEVHTEQIAC
uniref:C2H2-type domain-containing protein n=1 Tax=Erpetoichthys calabaricus TaxID=27687 RepID=A0A8C4SQZ3_ERPCA